jgi:dipeptidase E
MRLLLTSAGICNTSIRNTLVELLGKPITDSSALCVPTAAYPFPHGASMAYQLIHGVADTPLCELGWKSLGVLELTALPSIEKERWIMAVRDTDALLVGGGDPRYLCDWMQQSGLADLFPSLHETVYVGVSAGSTVMAPKLGRRFAGSTTPTSDDGLGVVNFAMFPHLDDEELPGKSITNAEEWAARVPVPAYAIDDQTAIKVTDDVVEVVSEGHWKLFAPGPETS